MPSHSMNLPHINDVTTDVASPPKFVALAKRSDGANSSAYPGQKFADQQTQAYPDLRTLVIERSVEEAFDLVEEAVRKLRWRVAAAEPPTGRPVKAGVLEATDQTMLDRVYGRYRHPRRGQCQSRAHRRALGIALRPFRFRPERDSRAQISRRGPGARRGDLYRRRRPSRGSERAGAGAAQTAESGRSEKAGSRTGRGPAQSNVQRAPAQKERPR